MGTTIRLPGGERTVICNDRHFVEILRKYIGDDAADWFKERVADRTENLEEIKMCLLSGETKDALEIVKDMLETEG